jgi:hypothetical protein
MSRTEWRKPRLPDRLERMLRDRRLSQPKARWWIRTNAKCSNRRIGALLARYLFRELSEHDRRRFEEHVRSCIACGTAVHDSFELERDLKARRRKP